MKQKENSKIYILGFLIFLFIIQSYIPVFKEALSYSGSSDFHWAPAKCAFNGINHYQAFIIGDKTCKIFMTQFGDYLQAFYVVMYPFTLLEWEMAKAAWLIVNIFFLILITNMISKKLDLDLNEKLISYFFVFFCITTKINFIMGQQALFVLFFLILPFLKESKKNYFFAGLCYVKYNIGYALFLYLVVNKKYKSLALTLIPIIIGWLFYAYITKSPLILSIFDPLFLLLKNFQILNGLNHKFIATPFINFTDNYNLNLIIIVLLIFVFNFLILTKISKIKDNLTKVSLISLLILISFPHWSHDYIILIPLFMISLKNFFSHIIYKINMIVCIYFLHLHKVFHDYTVKFLNFINVDDQYIVLFGNTYPYINILILIICLGINLLNNDYVKTSKNEILNH